MSVHHCPWGYQGTDCDPGKALVLAAGRSVIERKAAGRGLFMTVVGLVRYSFKIK